VNREFSCLLCNCQLHQEEKHRVCNFKRGQDDIKTDLWKIDLVSIELECLKIGATSRLCISGDVHCYS
jgi:hypothetical protein